MEKKGRRNSEENLRHRPEWLEANVRRALLGELPAQPPAPRLPEDKTSFPKLLCLDFNKWVALARSRSGLDKDPAPAKALAAIDAGIRSGKLVVPLTDINIWEAAAPRNSGQRKKMADFMVQLSQNLSLINGLVVARLEFVAAVRHLLFGALPPPSLRPLLVQRGLDAAVLGKSLRVHTGNRDLDSFLNLLNSQPELSAAAIAQILDDAGNHALKSREDGSLPKLEAIRKACSGQSFDKRSTDELRNAVDGKQYRDALSAEGLPVEEILQWLQDEENARAALPLLPHLDVGITLIWLRDANPQHPIRGTDARDLPFFRLAVPYANVIVAEKAWSHLATAGTSPLGKRYGTTVLTKLADVPAALQSIGCL